MGSGNPVLSAWSHGVAGAAYTAFALYLLRIGTWRQPGQHAARLLLAAVAASALWGWFGTADLFASTVLFIRLGALADLLAYACWFAFLLVLLRPRQDQPGPSSPEGTRHHRHDEQHHESRHVAAQWVRQHEQRQRHSGCECGREA